MLVIGKNYTYRQPIFCIIIYKRILMSAGEMDTGAIYNF